jgi:pyridoxamine 5'-phosphate oxidase
MSSSGGLGAQGAHEHRALHRADLRDDPVEQFLSWLADAEASGIPLPNAMALATTGADARPSVRHVLLRAADEHGFVFYTNHESRKGRQLAENPHAAAVFLWRELDRQVTVSGSVTRVADHEADAYFATRPRQAQIGAWASPQSAVLSDREELDRRVAETDARFAAIEVPRPPHWGGYRIAPDTIEFWQGRAFRLHDRFVYTRDPREPGAGWLIERLSP